MRDWLTRLDETQERFVAFLDGGGYIIHTSGPEGDCLWRRDVPGVLDKTLVSLNQVIVDSRFDRVSNTLIFATDPANREELIYFAINLCQADIVERLDVPEGVTLAAGPVFSDRGERWLSLEVFTEGKFHCLAARLGGGPCRQILASSSARIRLLARNDEGAMLFEEPARDLNAHVHLVLPDGIRQTLNSPGATRTAQLFDDSAILLVGDLGEDACAVWRIDRDGARRLVFAPSSGELDDFVQAPNGRWACAIVYKRLGHHLLLVRDGLVERTVTLPARAILSNPVFSICERWLGLTVDQPFCGPGVAIYDIEADVWIVPPVAAEAHCQVRSTWLEAGSTAFEIGLYLPEKQPGQTLPVMVSAHGGPAARFDHSQCHEIEAFIDFGCAVVAPNFRGSTGYGRRFREMGRRRNLPNALIDWRRTLDNLDTLLGVQPGPVIQMGASYGSFPVFHGSIDRPPAATIVLFGISDFPTMLRTTAAWRRSERQSEYGSLCADLAYLTELSPLRRLSQLQAPLLMTHGTHDVRVNVEQSRAAFEVALGGARQILLQEVVGEGHGYRSIVNRRAFIDSMHQFLRAHHVLH